MLTLRQKQTYDAIKTHIEQNGVSPTIAEVAMAIGIRSRGSTHAYIQALIDSGWVRGIPGRRRNLEIIPRAPKKIRGLRVLGYIAAGQPIEAIEQPEILDFDSLLEGEDRFALRVKGDSMIEEGIFNGDLVICESRQTANNGEIVVALIDNEEATLKRFQRKDKSTISLLPANSRMKPMHYPPERVKIQGVLVGLVRFGGA